MSKKLTAEDLVASAWHAVLTTQPAPDKVPAGWFTAKQLAKHTGKAGSTIGTQLCHAVGQGRCERKSFRIRTGQIVRPVPHYRLK
jgi:hypothetical protein